MSEVIMMVGCPASGKGSVAAKLAEQGNYVVLNRDSVGGRVIDLLPKMQAILASGGNVILDNTNPRVEHRWPFIKACRDMNVPIRAVHVDTPPEQCMINALFRMWSRYGKIYFDGEELKAVEKDPNMFPPVVIFSYKKDFEKPNVDEGFASVERIKFCRRPITVDFPDFTGKALFLDYDDTLRRTLGGGKWPTEPSQIEILPRRREILRKYINDGYRLLGVSNQSGIGARTMTQEQAETCFRATNKMLGFDIHYRYCPHRPGPIICYCRKPQSGIPVSFICHYKLDPAQCIFVGDQTTDKTCAERLGIPYVDQAHFFK